jgi:hypothetical protein
MDPLESQLRQQAERSRDFFWHRLRWRVVSDYLPPDRPFQLLDIGAGAGMIGSYLSQWNPLGRYRFIERIEPLEARLEARHGRASNAGELGSYAGIEFITLLDVLEHQEDDRAFLSDLVRRMDPGAVLLLTVPALTSLWSAWDVALGHHRRYGRAELIRTLSGLPLRAREVSYLFPELVPGGLLRRVRHPPGRASVAPPEEFQFPDIPRPLNGFLYALGSMTLATRRAWPIGTSLFAALKRH